MNLWNWIGVVGGLTSVAISAWTIWYQHHKAQQCRKRVTAPTDGIYRFGGPPLGSLGTITAVKFDMEDFA